MTVTLASLDSYLVCIAYNLHFTHWPMADVDDILQEMRLYVLEQQKLPEFAQRTPGHIAKGAAWHVRHVLRDTYTRYHDGQRIAWADPLPEKPLAAQDDLDEAKLDARLLVEQLFDALPANVRHALELKLAGYGTGEIAVECAVTTATVCRWVHKAKETLCGLV